MYLVYILIPAAGAHHLPRRYSRGKVVRIIDRDTLGLLDSGNTQHRVRLAGIDTPGRVQPCGKKAEENLARIAVGQPARAYVNHLNGAIPGPVYRSHPEIGLMEPLQDRPVGAT